MATSFCGKHSKTIFVEAAFVNIRKQYSYVFRTSDSQSAGSQHQMHLLLRSPKLNSSAMLVNNQLVQNLPVEVFNHVILDLGLFCRKDSWNKVLSNYGMNMKFLYTIYNNVQGELGGEFSGLSEVTWSFVPSTAIILLVLTSAV